MSIFGSFDYTPRILERKPNLIDLQVRNRLPDVTGVRFWASHNFINLWGTTTTLVDSGMGAIGAALNKRQELFRVEAGGFYRSIGIKRRRLIFDEVYRGSTRAVFNLDDFISPAVPQPLPNDQQILFVSIQQERQTLGGLPVTVQGAVDTGEDILGPIFIIPTPSFFTILESSLVLGGYAPGGTLGTTVTEHEPVSLDLDYQNPNPIHLVLPWPTTSITIRNTDNIEGLFYSFGLDQQMVLIPAGGERTLFGSVKDILLASDNAAIACKFAIEANINLGASSGV